MMDAGTIALIFIALYLIYRALRCVWRRFSDFYPYSKR